MPNYQQAKIYKIECNISGKIYVGSTCEPTLARRLAGHVRKYKNYLKGKYNYVSSFDIIKDGDYDIILIESFPCDSKDQLYAKERYWTNELVCVNKNRNQGLLNELGQKEYKKEYYLNHKDKICAYKNEKNNCQCGGFYTNSHKSHHLKTIKHQNYIKTLNNGIKPII